MARLTFRDLSRLLAFANDCYALRDLDAFARHAVAAVPRLIPCDITSYNEVNVVRGTNRQLWNTGPPLPLDLCRVFDAHMSEHPLIAHAARTSESRTLKISDFLSRARFHGLGLYTEFYRRYDVEYQLAAGLQAGPRLVIGIALNRKLADFSERERLLLDQARAHLVQSYASAEAVAALRGAVDVAARATEEPGHGVVVLSRLGRVMRASATAREALASYFGGSRSAYGLPEPLARWVAHQDGVGRAADAVPPPREPLTIEREGRRLVVRHLCEREQCLLLLREEATVLEPAGLERLGLTRREAEVLAWLARGKSDAEIGAILAARTKTVSKHLERIYQKLGVENRTAAAATALEAGGVRSP